MSACYVYFLTDGEAIKIGKSIHGGKGRIMALQIGNPRELKLIGHYVAEDGEERRLHKQFAHLCVNGEWHRPDVELLEYIDSLYRSHRLKDYQSPASALKSKDEPTPKPLEICLPLRRRQPRRPTATGKYPDLEKQSAAVWSLWHRETDPFIRIRLCTIHQNLQQITTGTNDTPAMRAMLDRNIADLAKFRALGFEQYLTTPNR